ncbi:unnamed protein product [Cuscuta europaea]|uniref:MULE transposase domain-containing protein n=1 Tax=Cuscuta europaea TaxID=41803 RepID=A0A9P0ZI77_CUSEU|nr:unnamed protein product [Cuscuta europaea]
MVFTPFTGVDNHKKCITFGVGLLLKEDVESYAWLFRCFLNAMGREPKCIITDQDPSMKIAILQVFSTSCHRFCMWHIMSKVSSKVGPVLSKDSNFMKELNSIVWSHYLEPFEFEMRWTNLMKEYDLIHHNWFSHMLETMRLWIPAYFGDIFMAGLLRTTSRSESENIFFNEFTNPNFSLVEFYMQFESALDSQRHKSAQLTKVSESSIPEYKTPLHIERYASSVYNHSIFISFRRKYVVLAFLVLFLVLNMKAACLSISYQMNEVLISLLCTILLTVLHFALANILKGLGYCVVIYFLY